MAQQQASGKPWSGTNKIPTISQFIDNLDRDKKQRDQNVTAGTQPQQQNVEIKNQDVTVPHKNQERMKDAKPVSDPVTGGQVMISDVGREYMENATNPKVCLPRSTYCCKSQC